MKAEITGLVIAKNEARDLPGTLTAWMPAFDSLVVINDGSTDATRDIAISSGAKVIDACMDETGYAGLRNTGLEAVETSHVLVVDADERPSSQILQSIRDALAGDPRAAYRFKRRDHAFGGWMDHGRFGDDWQIRLFPSSVRYEGLVHELPMLTPDVAILDLEGAVEHFTYRTLGEYITKMVSYAQKNAAEHEILTLHRALGAGPANYVKRAGYRDGWRGLAMLFGDSWEQCLIRHYRQTALLPEHIDPSTLPHSVQNIGNTTNA